MSSMDGELGAGRTSVAWTTAGQAAAACVGPVWLDQLKHLCEQVSDPTYPSFAASQQFLSASIGDVVEPDLITVAAYTSVQDAVAQMREQAAQFALVQDSPTSIQGIVELERLEELAADAAGIGRELVVASVMSRNVSLEPHIASVREVSNRIIWGGCRLVTIVDRLGEPVSVVSAETLVRVILRTFPDLSFVVEERAETSTSV